MINWLERRNVRWMNLLVVLGALALSAWAGTRAASFSGPGGVNAGALVPFVAPVAGLVLLLIATRDLRWLMIGMLAMGALVDVAISTGTQTKLTLPLLLSGLICVLWFAPRLLGAARASLTAINGPVGPVILFLVLLCLSWLLSGVLLPYGAPRPGSALLVQGTQVVIFALSFGVMLAAANVVWTERMLVIVAVMTILVSIVGNVADTLDVAKLGPLNLVAPALTTGTILLMAQVVLNKRLPPVVLVASIALSLLWGAGIALTDRIRFAGNWIPIVAALPVLIWMRSRWLWAAATLGAILLLSLNTQRIDNLIAGEQASLLRPYIWWDVIRMTLDSVPAIIFGLGPASYKWNWLNPSFVSTAEVFSGVTFLGIGDASVYYAPPSHNLYVDVYAQSGILGTIVFLFILLGMLRVCWRVARTSPNGFIRAYASGTFAALVGMLVVSGISAEWLVPFVYNLGTNGFRQSVYVWLLVGTVFSVARFGVAPPD